MWKIKIVFLIIKTCHSGLILAILIYSLLKNFSFKKYSILFNVHGLCIRLIIFRSSKNMKEI